MFARPIHSYLGLSPGLDFETPLFAKVNAPELLLRELARASYVPEPIALGVNTDAYQLCERQYGLTRRVLAVLNECVHPVGLITKSALIERDIDLIGARRRCRSPSPRSTLPFRAPYSRARLRTIRRLTDAVGAYYVVLRLPWEVDPLFQQWLQAHFPEHARRVMNRVRGLHGGKDYDSDLSRRMQGAGVWADLIRQRFTKTVERLGMGASSMRRFDTLDLSRFRRPLVVPAAASRHGGKVSGHLDLF